MDEDQPMEIIVPLRKRTREPKAVAVPAVTRKTLHDVPKDKRVAANKVPIDVINAGSQHYSDTVHAKFSVGDGARLLVDVTPPRNKKKHQIVYECALLDRDDVVARLQDKVRPLDIAMWQPELFWNGRYHKVLKL